MPGILGLSACVGCMGGDLGTSVAHKPHEVSTAVGLHKSGGRIGGAADLDLIPAPPGIKTGTPK